MTDRPGTDGQEPDPLGFNPYGSGPVPIRLRSETQDAPVYRVPRRRLEAALLIFYP